MDIAFKLLDFNIWSLFMAFMTFGIIYPKWFGPPNSDTQNYLITELLNMFKLSNWLHPWAKSMKCRLHFTK